VKGTVLHVLDNEESYLAIATVAEKIHQAAAEELSEDLYFVLERVVSFPQTTHYRALHGNYTTVLEHATIDLAMVCAADEILLVEAPSCCL
jgi:hypothetical protein